MDAQPVCDTTTQMKEPMNGFGVRRGIGVTSQQSTKVLRRGGHSEMVWAWQDDCGAISRMGGGLPPSLAQIIRRATADGQQITLERAADFEQIGKAWNGRQDAESCGRRQDGVVWAPARKQGLHALA